MTNEQTTSNSSGNAWENTRNPWNTHDYLAWAKTPGFNPMKAVAVVAGFAIFPPLGAAALLYFLWKGRRYGAGGPAYAMGQAEGNGPAGGWRGHRHGGGCGHRGMGGRGRWTGNAAFDQHQADVIQKLRAEREAFWAYRAEARAKRDREAYEAFRAAEAAKTDEPKAE